MSFRSQQTKVSVMKPQLNPARALMMTLRALKVARHNCRHEPEEDVDFQLDTHDFRVLFNGGTKSLIRNCGWSEEWWVSEVNRVILDFWGEMAISLPSANLASVKYKVSMPLPQPQRGYEQN